MSRITQIAPENAQGKTQQLFHAVEKSLGMVPNLMRAVGNSPAALEGYLNFSGGLAKGTLSAQHREQIALAVAQKNGCDYCLAAHSALGKMVGLTSQQIHDSRALAAVESKTETLLKFVGKVIDTRGHVDDADLQDLRDAGFTEGDVAETVANVALNIFTNYFNHVAETDVDFPRAEPLVGVERGQAFDANCGCAVNA